MFILKLFPESDSLQTQTLFGLRLCSHQALFRLKLYESSVSDQPQTLFRLRTGSSSDSDQTQTLLQLSISSDAGAVQMAESLQTQTLFRLRLSDIRLRL